MPQTYPTSPAFEWPVRRTLEFRTEIHVGEDGTEQRTAITAGEAKFILTYPRLTYAQLGLLVTFFEACKGAFDSTISFALNGTTYTGLHFDADTLNATDESANRYASTVTLRQPVRAFTAGTIAAAFPALTSGAAMQRPYGYSRTFATTSVSTEGGRFAWYRNGTSYRGWTAGGPNVSDTDADAIWLQFALAAGRLKEFAFDEPETGDTYDHCRFADDLIERVYLGPDSNSIQTRIQEIYGA